MRSLIIMMGLVVVVPSQTLLPPNSSFSFFDLFPKDNYELLQPIPEEQEYNLFQSLENELDVDFDLDTDDKIDIEVTQRVIEKFVNYAGDLLLLNGSYNLVSSVQRCSDLCIEHPLCNVFGYCGIPSGCMPELNPTRFFEYQRCDLKFSSSVANGGKPDVYAEGNTQTTFTAGYLINKTIDYDRFQYEFCPTSEDSVLVVFGEKYPMIRLAIIEDQEVKDLMPIRGDSDVLEIDQFYLQSINDNEREFCVTENETGTLVGDLVIYADESFPVNLQQLSNLTMIGGNLVILGIENTNLHSFEGLSNLVEIQGSLYIDNVSSIAGLDSLQIVGGNVTLKNIADLNTLRLTEIRGDLRISGNIHSLHGLESIRTIGGHLSIINTNLYWLAGLSGLTKVNRSLIINNNLELFKLQGLDNLREVETLLISHNPWLRYLRPLNSMLEAAKTVHIYENGGPRRNESQALFNLTGGLGATFDQVRTELEILFPEIKF